MSSILYDPAQYGVEIVASLDPEDAYQFHTLLVVKSIETGELYAAFDSGCSCPMPFEDTKFPSDFVHIRELRDLDAQINEHFSTDSDQWKYNFIDSNKLADFKGTVRVALRKQAADRRAKLPHLRIGFSSSDTYKPLGGLYADLPGLAAEYPHLVTDGPYEGLNAVNRAVETLIEGSIGLVKQEVYDLLLKLSMDSWTLGYDKGMSTP